MHNLSDEETIELMVECINKPSEWRKEHCPICINDTIFETYFDKDAAEDYLKSIGKLSNLPIGTSRQDCIMSANEIALLRGDQIRFNKTKVYKCPYKYCKGKDREVKEI